MYSTIPGSPAYPGTGRHFPPASSHHGMADVDDTGKNAVQGSFRFSA